MKKFFLFFALFAVIFAQVGMAQAQSWNVPSKAFGLSQNLKLSPVNPSPAGEDDFTLIPTASLGFGVGSGSTVYGYTGAYDLVFGHVSQGSASGTASLTPYLGVGGALFVDFGDWINSGLHQPVKADGGFNIIGPQIQGLVPSFEIVWNFQTGEEVKTVNLTAPFGLFSDSAVLKLFGL